jgi:hypothetical protein
MEPAPNSTQAERERAYPAAVPPHALLDELTLSYPLEPRFESSATFMRYEGPNFAVAVILAYHFVQTLIVVGRSVRTMVMEGRCGYVLGGNDEQGRYVIRRWVEELPPPFRSTTGESVSS